MSQLSRPYQIAIGAIAVLAAVWFVALRGHSSTTSESPSTPASHTTAPAATSTVPGSASAPSAPGVAGLTRAIEKARGAVKESERNAKQLEQKSAAASSPSATGGASAPAGAAATGTISKARSGSLTAQTRTGAARSHALPSHRIVRTHHNQNASPTVPGRLPARQALVEGELKQGYIVALLFLNPEGADDVLVRDELHTLQASKGHSLPSGLRQLLAPFGRELGDSTVVLKPAGRPKKVALMMASATQVPLFGSFTRAVEVDQTPTLLLINKHGQITSITGLTDAFSIEQAIDEPQNS